MGGRCGAAGLVGADEGGEPCERQEQATKRKELDALGRIMNAYLCFARQTGCRPGMAVNDASDAPLARVSRSEREGER